MLSEVSYRSRSRSTCRARAYSVDFLYGDMQGKDLPEAFEDLRDYDAISKYTEKDWIDLLNK